MNRKLAWLVAATDLALLLLVAGCNGGGTSPVTPAVGAAGASAAARSDGATRTRLEIQMLSLQFHHRARYISPATKSISVSISRAGKKVLSKVVNLTPGSPGCNVSLGSTVCTLALNLGSGDGYKASLTAYDGLKAKGKVLSTGQSLLFDVKAGKDNTVSLTLNGVPASILVKQTGSSSVLVTALDAGGNFIVGPGAPVFVASKTSGSAIVTITQPSSSSPNTIGLALANHAAPPATETIGVKAGYPAGTANACAERGAVCSLATAVTAKYLIDGTFFVGDYGNGYVKGFSTPFSSSSETPAYALPVPSAWAVALDHSANVFALDYSTGTLYEYLPPYTGSAVTNSGVAADAVGIAFNSVGDLFTGSERSSYPVTEIAPPYTGAATAITSGVLTPYGVAVDAADNLYVANNNSDTLGVYASGAYTTEKYTVTIASPAYSATRIGSNLYVGESNGVQIFALPITSSAATPTATITNGASSVWGVALDATGDLFLSNSGTTVTEYPAPVTSGEAPSVTLSHGLNQPCGGLTFDANGDLYVVDYSAGQVAEFVPPFTNSSAPVAVVSGLSSPCFGGLVSGSTGSFTFSVP